MKRKVTLKRNGIFTLNIRPIAVRNREEYMNDLKMQAIRLQIEKIVHFDPQLKSLLNFKPNRKHYTRSLFKNQLNRSYDEQPQQQIESHQRAKSTEGSIFGDTGLKFKRLMSRGTIEIKMHRFLIRKRFRKLVLAVCLLLTYFRYNPQRRKMQRLSRPRISIFRSRNIIDRLPQLLQIEKANTVNESQTSREPPSQLKKKHSSLGSFDMFMKRPIQQFIVRQNTDQYSQKRICKTEHSQVQSMYNFFKKQRKTKMFQKSSSIKLISLNQ
ncbi:unnamed protein product [Paramecium primaurelia]|uniref:Uncharacterized protein n=1 Tax=Paramecium primaurelia TaxID=5886 RepID=A0A8S1PTU6_PARPR|nr:unnamed protein product [Paramecium primaurelia]